MNLPDEILADQELLSAEREVRSLLERLWRMHDQLREIRASQKECEREVRLTREGFASRPVLEPPSGKGNHADPTANSVVRIIDWYQAQSSQLDERAARLIQSGLMLQELTKPLADIERKIIELRWIKGDSWVKVGLAVHLCERQAQRTANKAIRCMAVLLRDRRRLDYSTQASKLS